MPTQDQAVDPVKRILDMSPTLPRERMSAWDAFAQASDPDDLVRRLDAIKLPTSVKSQLWELKNQQHAAQAPEPPLHVERAAPQSPGRNYIGGEAMFGSGPNEVAAPGAAAKLLPTAGGMIGGTIGSASGPIGAAIGATAGGALGRTAQRAVEGRPIATAEGATDIAGQAAIQGGSQVFGQSLGVALKKAAPWLMQKALKPTETLLREYRTTAPKLVQTLFDEGVNVTEAGLSKLQKLFESTNDDIRAAVAGATGSIPKERVAARALPTAAKMGQQTNPTKDLQAVGETVQEFLDHPVYKGNLSVPEAQAMKVGTYRQIGKKYGEVSSASIETQKALARGLKEEIAEEVPGLAGLNATDSELMAALDAVGRRVALSGNKDPVGFAWVTAHPMTFMAALFDRSPAVKSFVARGMYDMAGKVGKVSPDLIRVAIVGLAQGGSAPTPVPSHAPSSSPAPVSSHSTTRPQGQR